MQTLNAPDQRVQPNLLRGISVADRRNPIITHHQLGGEGVVLNKALAIPFHLPGGHVASIEYVSVLGGASVGEHYQDTDEIYYLVKGAGELITNGEKSNVRAGDLVIAPKGTTHSIRSYLAQGPLCFLVIEVKAPLGEPFYRPTVVGSLPQLLCLDNERYPTRKVFGGQGQKLLRLTEIALHSCFSGPWGTLTLLEFPPGCHTELYSMPEHDENIFLIQGHAAIALEGLDAPFLTDEDPESCLNVFVPAGLLRQITNRSITESLLVLSVQICHS